MRIAAISDLHGQLPATPECDLLIIGGDVCPFSDHDLAHQRAWIQGAFSYWLSEQPAKRVVWIAGNHDFAVQASAFWAIAADLPSNTTYLEDELVEVDGLRIWGTPWVTDLPRWAFNAAEWHLREVVYPRIEPCDVLVSHAPPRGSADTHALDFTVPHFGSKHVGSPSLCSRIEQLAPRLVICGHIHEGRGLYEAPGGATIANVSYLDENFAPRDETVMIFEL